MRPRTVLFASLVLGGCGDKVIPRPANPAQGIAVPEAPPPAPELALQASDSVAVWFTSARTDTSADGTACLERVMEIRAGDRTIPIPLLYTGENPTIINDSTIQVHIWRHCVPADPYRVHLRTGQPTRVGA